MDTCSCLVRAPQRLYQGSARGQPFECHKFTIVSWLTANGWPVWKSTSEERWLYMGTDMRWYIGGEDERAAEFQCCRGYISSSLTPSGCMPQDAKYWRFFDTAACMWRRNVVVVADSKPSDLLRRSFLLTGVPVTEKCEKLHKVLSKFIKFYKARGKKNIVDLHVPTDMEIGLRASTQQVSTSASRLPSVGTWLMPSRKVLSRRTRGFAIVSTASEQIANQLMESLDGERFDRSHRLHAWRMDEVDGMLNDDCSLLWPSSHFGRGVSEVDFQEWHSSHQV